MIRRAVKAGVSSYVIDSVSPERLDALMEVAVAQFEAFQNLRAERDDATRKLSERITIDRAKGVLIDECGMKESEAFTFIQRTAMSERGNGVAAVPKLFAGHAVQRI